MSKDATGGYSGRIDGNEMRVIPEFITYLDTANKAMLVPFVLNSGGSGSFVYMAYLEKNMTGFQHINSVFVGDRIQIDAIRVKEMGDFENPRSPAILDYTTRTPDTAYSLPPTIPAHMMLSVSPSGMLRADQMVYNGDFADAMFANIEPYQKLDHTVHVKGAARGSWFFEANIGIRVEDMNGVVLWQTNFISSEDWMTGELVGIDINLDIPETIHGDMYLVIAKDNASGLTAHDSYLKIPVQIE